MSTTEDDKRFEELECAIKVLRVQDETMRKALAELSGFIKSAKYETKGTTKPKKK